MNFKSALLAVVGSAPNRPDREQLRAAIVARDDAQRAVVDARATANRLQDIINQANDASRVALRAALKATEKRRRWVLDNCPHSVSGELQALDDAATEAAQVAARTAQDVDVIGKTQALSRAQSVLQSAELDLKSRETEIGAAIGVIIAAEEAPLREQYDHAADVCRALRVRLKVLERVLEPGRYEDAGAKSHEGAREVAAALRRGAIKSWDQERDDADARDFIDGARGRDAAMLEQIASKWHERAKALRENPDA